MDLDKEELDAEQINEIKKKIEEMVTALGATGEFLGALRESLLLAGFSRQEAVYMCLNVLVGIITKLKGDNND